MDSDRKYGQRGYQDSDRQHNAGRREDKPRFQGPRPPIDVTGPKLPRLVESVTASRCWNCSTTLPGGADFKSNCPKCNSALHCCKQCTHFEPSTRFQCLKPIPERVNKKDVANECTFFKPRVTVARDTPQGKHLLGPIGNGGFGNGGYSNGNNNAPSRSFDQISAPRSAQDARAAFESLFKK